MIKSNFITLVEIDLRHWQIIFRRWNTKSVVYSYWGSTHRISHRRFSRQGFDKRVVMLLNIAFRNGFEVSYIDDLYFPRIVICNVPQDVV